MSIRVDFDAADIAFLRYMLQQKADEAQSKARVCHESGDNYMHGVLIKQQSQLLLLKAKLDGVTDEGYLAYLNDPVRDPRD